MSRDWIQVRLRLPPELHAEIEAQALASGSTMQRELLSRVMRGDPRSQARGGNAPEYAVIAGELEVATKLIDSLSAMVNQMKRAAATAAIAAPHHNGNGVDNSNGE